MKVFAIIAILFAASEASLIRQPIPYNVYVSLGGLPLPEALREKDRLYTMEDVYNNSRIVGGSTAPSGAYPWLISLRRSTTSSHICGGSILNNRAIVTAAHCVDGSSSLAIRYNSLSHGSGGTLLASSAVIKHASYNSATIDYDVATVKFSSDISYGTNAQPVGLTTSEPTSGNLNVAGWGTTSSGGSSPSVVNHVSVPVVAKASCRSSYGTSAITDRMLCAGTTGRDSCQGDSGGPLTSGNTLVGIVSWGRGCAAAGYPGVYASVAALRTWIVANS